MAALTVPTTLTVDYFSNLAFPMVTGKTCYQGGVAALVAGKVQPLLGAAGQVVIGEFIDTVVNATGADVMVNVDLKREVKVVFLQNDGTNPVLATTLGQTVYGIDDQTVSALGTGRSPLGIAWVIDPQLGVGVELI